MRRSLEHGDGHTTDPAGIILNADVCLVDESSRSTFGPHRPVYCFQGDQVGLAVSLIHLRQKVRVGDELFIRGADATVGTLVGIGDPLHLLRRQFHTNQHCQQTAAWFLVGRPAFPGLFERLCIPLLIALAATF